MISHFFVTLLQLCSCNWYAASWKTWLFYHPTFYTPPHCFTLLISRPLETRDFQYSWT